MSEWVPLVQAGVRWAGAGRRQLVLRETWVEGDGDVGTAPPHHLPRDLRGGGLQETQPGEDDLHASSDV